MSAEPAKIRVAVRVRPILENELKNNHQNTKIDANEEKGEVIIRLDERERDRNKTFKFDHVFSE